MPVQLCILALVVYLDFYDQDAHVLKLLSKSGVRGYGRDEFYLLNYLDDYCYDYRLYDVYLLSDYDHEQS